LDDEIELEIEPYEEYNLVGENDSDVVLKNSIEMLQVDYLSHSNVRIIILKRLLLNIEGFGL
jgi:hypothetical protein